MTALPLALLQVVLAAASALLFVSAVLLLLGFILGAPFVPTPFAQVETMVRLARPKPGELWVDLGSGDGRILLAAARTGARAVGYEFHPLLVLLSRFAIARSGLRDRAAVAQQDLWKADLSEAGVVSLFLIQHRMAGVKRKLLAELKPGARVVSYAFDFAGWEPAAREDRVSLYVVPAGPRSGGV